MRPIRPALSVAEHGALTGISAFPTPPQPPPPTLPTKKWDASPTQGYPQQYVAGTLLYTWVGLFKAELR